MWEDEGGEQNPSHRIGDFMCNEVDDVGAESIAFELQSIPDFESVHVLSLRIRDKRKNLAFSLYSPSVEPSSDEKCFRLQSSLL